MGTLAPNKSPALFSELHKDCLMSIYIVPFYTAFLGLFYVGLSLQVIKLRRKHKVSLGDKGEEEIQRAIRAHSNFSEYIPMVLLLALMAELNSVHPVALNLLLATALLGRALHAYGISQKDELISLRVRGMLLTLFPIIILSVVNLFLLI